jgi:hypothetical protein
LFSGSVLYLPWLLRSSLLIWNCSPDTYLHVIACTDKLIHVFPLSQKQFLYSEINKTQGIFFPLSGGGLFKYFSLSFHGQKKGTSVPTVSAKLLLLLFQIFSLWWKSYWMHRTLSCFPCFASWGTEHAKSTEDATAAAHFAVIKYLSGQVW